MMGGGIARRSSRAALGTPVGDDTQADRVDPRDARTGAGRDRAVAAAGRRSNGYAGSCSPDPARETHPMSTASPAIRNLTPRLIALEAARDDASGSPAPGAARALEALRA